MTLSSERIALSWQRASMHGLEPDLLPREIDISPIVSTSRLLDAARPVMDRLGTIFRDIDCSVILADRNVRLVDIRHGTPLIGGALSNNGAVPGRLFTEESSGTNAISTVRELREPLAVRGNEHFFEAMKMFSCYGFPILHPTSGRIEGVITLIFYTAGDSPLLHAMAMQGAEEIARRLVPRPFRTDHDLLDAFHEAAAHAGGAPMLAMSSGIVIANSAAAEKLTAVDYVSLRAHNVDLADRGLHALNSGEQFDVRVRKVDIEGPAMVVELGSGTTESAVPNALMTRNRSRIDRIADHLANSRRNRTSLAIAGEPGTGRSTLLTELLDGHSPATFDALDSILASEREWLRTVIDALNDGNHPVSVDNAHLLSPLTAHGLHDAVVRSGTWFAVASDPLISLSPSVLRLVDGVHTRVELLPLRLRKHEIPALVDGLLTELDAAIRFTPSALRALIDHDWPGNLTELRAEVLAVTRFRSAGDVTDRDLERLRVKSTSASLGTIDGALRTVIEHELERHRGNKLAVAKSLNISRTTLYKRMRAFGIDG